MTGFFKFILGCVMVATLGVLGINLDMLPGSAASAQDKLQARIAERLQGTDVSWATINIDGQRVTVAGEAPSIEARDGLIDTLAGAAGSGGPVMGGVTLVDATSVSVYEGPPLASPFTWTAMLQNDEIFLSGFAPSQNAKDTILQLTTMRFPDKAITGELEIASGAPSEDDWISAVSISLQAIARLEEGVVEASDNEITISGVAASDTDASAAQVYLSTLPETITATTDLKIATLSEADTPSPVEAEAPEEDEGALCQSQLEEAIGAVTLSFESNRATVDNASAGELRTLAEALAGCPQFSLEILGHTDSSGSETRNRRLSQDRADAVSAILASAGIDRSRLTARGVGSSQPVASNASARGRAQNRRIELILQSAAD